jgi:low affinity Fe/Cu permease
VIGLEHRDPEEIAEKRKRLENEAEIYQDGRDS